MSNISELLASTQKYLNSSYYYKQKYEELEKAFNNERGLGPVPSGWTWDGDCMVWLYAPLGANLASLENYSSEFGPTYWLSKTNTSPIVEQRFETAREGILSLDSMFRDKNA